MYEITLFDISNYGMVQGQTVYTDFVPADPGALAAAVVAVSKDNQNVYAYFPESTVRPLESFTLVLVAVVSHGEVDRVYALAERPVHTVSVVSIVDGTRFRSAKGFGGTFQ